MISANLLAIFYLISGVLFILALRGLSSPETSRRGNLFGIIGMAIAIGVTVVSVGNFSTAFLYLLILLIIGGSIGSFIAFKIPMTAMPELVAGFHSLVGLAAVFVAISAFLNPVVFNLGSPGDIKIASLIEMSLGAAIGAITFTGSIIAFLKLRGIMSGAPITFKGQHLINLLLGLSIIFLIYYLCIMQSSQIFWTVILISFIVGVLLIIPIGGDGFLLKSLHDYKDLNKSFYGINYGSVGFLMNNQSNEELEEIIISAQKIELKPLQMKAINNKGEIYNSIAFNEVSLMRQTYQAAKISIKINEIERMKELI